MRAGRGSCLASSLPDSLTSPPRACRVLIIPGVAVFYFETKRGLLMGIQLKPAANICFDAAAAAGQAGGGSRRRGPRCARQSRGWNALRGRALGPAASGARASQGLSAGRACSEGCPGASCGRADPAVRGRRLRGPLIRPGALSGARGQGWRSRARGREGWAQSGAAGTVQGPAWPGRHTSCDSIHVYGVPTTVWRLGIEQ